MTALSDYAEALVLNWLLTAGAVTRPTNWYVALYTTASDDADTATEVVGNGYVRQPVACAAASSPGGTTESTDAQSYTASGGNWGTLTHIGIFDASTGGNLLWHGAMGTPRILNDGDTLTFSVGNIDLAIA